MKLLPVMRNRRAMSPLLVLAVGDEFGTLTIDPVPPVTLVSVNTRVVATVRDCAGVIVLFVTLVVPV